jgi:leucyl aminopeptidase
MKFFSTTTTTAGYGLWCLATRLSISSAFGATGGGVNSGNSGINSIRSTGATLSQWIPRSYGLMTVRTSSQQLAAKIEPPFTTWTFEKPCPTMAWSPLSHVSLVAAAAAAADETTNHNDNDSSDHDAPFPISAFLQADLLVIGVMAPAKDEKEEDDDIGTTNGTKKEEATTTTAGSTTSSILELQGAAAMIDKELGGAISAALTESIQTFKNGAKMGSLTPMVRWMMADGKMTRLVVLGLGRMAPSPSSSPEDAAATEHHPDGVGFTIGKALAQQLASLHQVTSVHVLLPAPILTTQPTLLRDLSTGLYQDLHTDNRYRTGDKVKKIAEDVQTVRLFMEGTAVGGPMDPSKAIEEGRQLATGVVLTKDIVNAPHNVLNSESLAETAKRIAKECPNGRIKCTVLGRKECEARMMGAYLGVARGSETEPQFIHVTYTPPANSGPIYKKVAVIGKGLLFDTGGYNIKTQMMECMKFDCGGAAAVLGAARAIGMLQPPGVEVHFIVAACENMINDKAMVPSDILTASNGKTIEVMNTDAEGRLTLADALVYADVELGCESIIELSTLTGACMVALGKSVSGVWTDNDALAEELANISKVTGDKSWRMPLEKEYNELLESKFADMKNIGGKYAGSITAALFLQNFVSKKKPFAHIDIAGPVWSDKTGATGYGTKLIVEWVTRQGQSKKEE